MAPYAIQYISNLQVMTAWKIAKHRSGDEAGFPPMGATCPSFPFTNTNYPLPPNPYFTFTDTSYKMIQTTSVTS